MAEAVGTGVCNGSFGEVLQGVLAPSTGSGQSAGTKFLVNLPITMESRATLRLLPPAYEREKEERFAEAYRRWSKAHKAVRNWLALYGNMHDFELSIESEIPRGKGLSSSTADMVAALEAVGCHSVYQADHILRGIEPNDGLHYSGTSVYAHEEGRLLANYDWVPGWRIVGIDEGGTVDTTEFNRRPRKWDRADIERWTADLERAKACLEARDSLGLASVATASAVHWQEAHPKGHWAQVRRLCETTNALGIVNCHSGTYLGLVFPRTFDVADVVAEAQLVMPECDVRVFETRSTSSGQATVTA